MIGLVFQKVNFLSSLLILSQFLLLYLFLQSVLLFLQFLRSLLEVALLLLQFQNSGIEFGCALFGLKLFSHGEGQRALVKSFVGTDGHIEFVPNSHQQNSPFRGIDGGLSDDFVEALLVEFFANGANSWISASSHGYRACLTTNFSSSNFCSEFTSSLEGGLVLIFCL